MKIFLVLSTILAVATAQQCLCGQENTQRRIIDGKEAQSGRYPWMVYLQIGNGACGGSIINDRYVLTAAHCFPSGQVDPKTVQVFHGAHDLRRLSRPLVVEKVIVSANYNKHPIISFYSDIALIKLAQPLKFTAPFNPICLGNMEPSQDLLLTGWGLTRKGNQLAQTDTLQEGILKLHSVDACKQRQGRGFDPAGTFCAGERTNGCMGDSGGPLSQRQDGHLYQLGVVSYGTSDCNVNAIDARRPDGTLSPGVFTKISAHKKWIQDNTADAQWCKPGAKNQLTQ